MKINVFHEWSFFRSKARDWYAESCRAAAYRDEVDALREEAERAHKLELEMQRLRAELGDVHYIKTQAEKLRDDNELLRQTK